MRKLVLFVATGAGSGYFPIASGTVGSIVGLLVFYPIAGLSAPVYAAVVAGVVALGVWTAGEAERIFDSRDDSRITIDEVAGMLISLAFVPVSALAVVSAFFLFRLFDIWKPPPVRRLESLPGGVGVMADDVAAGLYANLIGQVVWRGLLPGGIG